MLSELVYLYVGYFKKLRVWQDSMVLIEKVYRLCSEGQLEKDFGLRNQVTRSAISIASNIAEGEERSSDQDSIRFFYYAKGSIAELITQIRIAESIGYVSSVNADEIESLAENINASLKRLIAYRSNSKNKQK